MSPPFWAARYLDAESRYLRAVRETGERVVGVTGGLRGVTAARLSPTPADAVSLGAGIAGVGTPAFVGGTILGELPWATLYVLAGSRLSELAFGDVGAFDHPLVLAALCLASVALLAKPAYDALSGR